MSYILDALRRAEADRERERGQVPGLHTQPLSGRTAAPAIARRRWLPWAGGGLLLLAGLGAGRWWAGPGDAAAPAPGPAPVAASTPATPAVPLAAASPAVPAGMTLPPQPASAPASPYLPPLPPPAPPPAAPVAAAPVAPASAPAAAEAAIPRLAELPAGLRRDLPRLAISGSVYSDDPAGRFVIVNGEVAREGARLGPELVLEQIRPRELVLRFRGQRYRQPV